MTTACLVFLLAGMATAQAPLAEWNFDEGRGDTARDSSGNQHDATLHGASFVPQGRGHAIMLDGIDDYLDFDKARRFAISGPIAFELWLKPMQKAHGMSCIIGEGLSSYLLTYYNTELCQLYIGDGGNSVKGPLSLDRWNHIAASFDGKMLTMWINGRQTGSVESKLSQYKTEGLMVIGTEAQPHLPRFKGMIDNVRVYNRGLTADEAAEHFTAEAAEYDYDPAWFTQVRLSPFYYFDRGQIVVEADYQEIRPLVGATRLEATLARKDAPDAIIDQQTISPLTPAGLADITLKSSGLKPGEHVIAVTLHDETGARPPVNVTFDYVQQAAAPLPSPNEKVVADLPPQSKPAPFITRVKPGGGFEIVLNGKTYPFHSRVSYPNGDFNHLTPAGKPAAGEPAWKVSSRSAGSGKWIVSARAKSYSLQRVIETFPTHVSVKDTYANLTGEDLGLMIYNETSVSAGDVTDSRLSGYERWGRQAQLTYPDYSPFAFFTTADTGMAIVPLDDVFIIQGLPYVAWENAAGVCTEKFALAPKASYMLEWAVYPTPSKDYYDFINTFRRVEDRIGTVRETPGFISNGPRDRNVVPTTQFIEPRGLTLGLIHCLSYSADDPDLHIEGIEFADFPIEMQRLKELAANIHKAHPGFKTIFHVAHNLYCTNNPDKFADSKVTGPDGQQVTWGNGDAFGPAHQSEGWRWWIFYPTPGNSFHEAMIKSVDTIMDDLGYDGIFMDGFLAGYGSMWTYDRWDGHSAEIDSRTKLITRKLGSVMLMSQPSVIELARKVADKGGVVFALHSVMTRSIANEKNIIFSNECATGPELHLAPTLTVLAATSIRSEKAMYLDMLDKLRWGELFVYYGAMFENLSDRTLASRQYPITFEEIRSGMVRGNQRIVTMNSGIYGWPGRRALHVIHKFDARGRPVAHEYLTTADASGVRTELAFNPNESAVIEPLPVDILCDTPVNVRVVSRDDRGWTLELNGHGDVTLAVDGATRKNLTLTGAATLQVEP